MRTTLDIAEDVLQAVKERARREKSTAGEVISRLARQALSAPPEAPRPSAPKARHGFRPFARRGQVVTNDRIDALREDDTY